MEQNKKCFSFNFFKEKINYVKEKIGNKNDFNSDILLSVKLNIEIFKRINDFIEKSMAKDGLVGATWIVLMIIYSSESKICAIDLCDILNQNKATVSRIIESLKEKKYITEQENELDRRKNDLIITEGGIEYIKNKINYHSQYFKHIFNGVNTEILLPELNKLMNNLNSYGGQND